MKSVVTQSLAVAIILTLSGAQKCPEFKCKNQEMNDTRACYTHSRDDPVSLIVLQECDEDNKKCFLEHGEYAWVDSNI